MGKVQSIRCPQPVSLKPPSTPITISSAIDDDTSLSLTQQITVPRLASHGH